MDMDTQKPVLSAISENDPELAQRLVDRRAAIKAGATVSGAVAAGLRMASIPSPSPPSPATPSARRRGSPRSW
jgi:hypothetical protein